MSQPPLPPEPGPPGDPDGSGLPSYGTPPGYGPPAYGAPPGYGPQTYAAGPYAAPGIADMGRRLLARLVDVGLYIGVWIGESIIGWVLDSIGLDPLARLLYLVVWLAVVAYEPVFVALRGATIGKQLLGLRVINATTGEVPGWGPSLVRWLVQALGAFLCGIGLLLVWLSPLFDNSGRRQGWHDKAAGTVVVKV